MVTYEYPLNERIRTLLRLEELFSRQAHFARGDSTFDHHAGLLAIFEVLEVAGRADLKVDLVQELERQRQILLSFRNNPDISESALAGALYEIEQASSALLAMNGKVGQYLRENDWLMSVRSRAMIPGGACQFDLPAYHSWLQREPESRRRDLAGWLAPMLPISAGVSIVLRLLRASGQPEAKEARRGYFQHMMAGRTAQMVRLAIAPGEMVVPETSANKYALSIRFMAAETVARPRSVDRDVGFELTFCSL